MKEQNYTKYISFKYLLIKLQYTSVTAAHQQGSVYRSTSPGEFGSANCWPENICLMMTYSNKNIMQVY